MFRTTMATPDTSQLSGNIPVLGIRWIYPSAIHRITPFAPGVSIGRDDTCTPPLLSSEVSRYHASMEALPGGRTEVVDHQSKNHIYLNGVRVQRCAPVAGDVLRIGDHLGLVGFFPAAGTDACELRELTRVDGASFWGGLELGSAMSHATRIASSSFASCVVIEGASGTGKRMLARALHSTAAREPPRRAKSRDCAHHERPFVVVHCAALGDLAQSRLFGRRKATLGGSKECPGYFSLANGGTLLLQEPHTLAHPIQSLLLRAVDVRMGQPVGGAEEGFDVRLMVSTQRPLAELVAEGTLLRDLQMRLERAVIRVPPLRERKGDIPALAQHFATRAAPREEIRMKTNLVEELCLRDWPGNVRELENHVNAMMLTKETGEALSRKHSRAPAAPGSLSPVAPLYVPTPATPHVHLVEPFDSAVIERPLSLPDGSTAITILVLASNPTGTGVLDLQREARSIKERLRLSTHANRFAVVQEESLRVQDLVAAILRHRPQVVHFSGHGSSDGELVIEDDAGRPIPLSQSAVAAVFAEFSREIQCVVLNACYSEGQAEAIAKHIDWVVGMRGPVMDDAAITFSAAFYQALGFGQSVGRAFRLGLIEIGLEGRADDDKPQLRRKARP